MTIAQHFRTNGIAIIEHALDDGDVRHMERAFAPGAGRRHGGMAPEVVAWLAAHPVLTRLAAELNGANRDGANLDGANLDGASSRLVRVIAFDKSPAANWFVPWHQDRAIAVAARADVPGFARWTVKDGALHVEPPVAILEAMVTLRVHIDDCTEADGPLEVVRGSHAAGRLEKAAIDRVVAAGAASLCLAARGDILAMRPLTVHRSQRAALPARRRVLHLEFAACRLPSPLTWALGDVTATVM